MNPHTYIQSIDFLKGINTIQRRKANLFNGMEANRYPYEKNELSKLSHHT